jgi:hypothetical protein
VDKIKIRSEKTETMITFERANPPSLSDLLVFA